MKTKEIANLLGLANWFQVRQTVLVFLLNLFACKIHFDESIHWLIKKIIISFVKPTSIRTNTTTSDSKITVGELEQ